MAVGRRKLFTTLTHNASGSISAIEVRVAYRYVDPLATSRDPLMDERFIRIGASDLTPADITAFNAIATRIDDIIERKDPLVE